MAEKYELEAHYRVYDNEHGEYIEVCPDADGLDLVEIRSCEADGTITNRVTFHPDCGQLVLEAIKKTLDNFEAKKYIENLTKEKE